MAAGFSEAPDLTARICGICPIAYQMSAYHAMEDACGVRIESPLRALRRLIYCGEQIESHSLHIYMLHAPDFSGIKVPCTLAAMDFGRQVWALCESAYREESRGGRPGIDPVIYFKMLMVGFFENLRRERAIAARGEDSLSVRAFL